MIDLKSEYLMCLKSILKKQVPGFEVRIFGSRVNGKAKEFSDIDIAIVGKDVVDWHIMEDLKNAFSESDIPYTVDVVDWNDISEEFRNIIDEKYVVISHYGN